MSNGNRRSSYRAPQQVHAVYRKEVVPGYIGNPFIEALPEIPDADAAAKMLQRPIEFSPSHRDLPAHIRHHCVMQLFSLVQPFGWHLELNRDLLGLLYSGYTERNVLDPSYLGGLDEAVNRLLAGIQPSWDASRAACSLAVIGPSGIGKSTAVRTTLSCLPQVIVHSSYHGRPFTWKQLVWFSIDCPNDGSVRSLCLSIILRVDALLGTTYHEMYRCARANVEGLIASVGRIAVLQGLGMLVIDEIRNLIRVRDEGRGKMLSLLVQMMNVLKIPIVLIGTRNAAISVLGGDFCTARRSSGLGAHTYQRMQEDEEFYYFCEALWPYQYLREPGELTDEMVAVLYDLSQGIADLVVKLFVLAQMRALALGMETLTVTLFRSVYRDRFKLLDPFLSRIRNGESTAEDALDDILPSLDFEDMAQMAQPVSPIVAGASGSAEPPVEGGTPESSLSKNAAPDSSFSTSRPRARKRRKQESACELVRIVEAAKDGESAHDALLGHGYIWEISKDVLDG